MQVRIAVSGAALVVLLLIGALLVSHPPAVAQTPEEARDQVPEEPRDEPADPAAELERLKEQIRKIEELHARQMRELGERLAELEAQLAAAESAREEEELAELLAEAEELTAEEAAREAEAARERETFVGGERALQALNPEISVLGDLSYDYASGPTKDGFLLRGLEISLQAPLDPYTRFKVFLAGHQEPFELPHEEGGEHEHEEDGEHAEEEEGHGHGEEIGLNVEEAYMEWVALPLNTRLRVGKFRQQFGTLNRWHPHALPTADSPFALQNVFGHEGLVGLGIGLDWQLPKLWATSNSLTLEITNADTSSAFAGADWDDPAFLLRHTGFFELGHDSYLDLGLNWAFGPNDAGGDHKTDVYGADFTYVWEPVNRAKYRNFELRGEYIGTRAETEDHGILSSDSFYAYLSTKLSRRWSVGFRYDDAELPWDRFELYNELEFREGLGERAWTPFLTFWQSEYVRMRLQYQNVSRDFASPRGDTGDERLWWQVTFAAGPHKHESY